MEIFLCSARARHAADHLHPGHLRGENAFVSNVIFVLINCDLCAKTTLYGQKTSSSESCVSEVRVTVVCLCGDRPQGYLLEIIKDH